MSASKAFPRILEGNSFFATCRASSATLLCVLPSALLEAEHRLAYIATLLCEKLRANIVLVGLTFSFWGHFTQA